MRITREIRKEKRKIVIGSLRPSSAQRLGVQLHNREKTLPSPHCDHSQSPPPSSPSAALLGETAADRAAPLPNCAPAAVSRAAWAVSRPVG
jgi:hypothetical protein